MHVCFAKNVFLDGKIFLIYIFAMKKKILLIHNQKLMMEIKELHCFSLIYFLMLVHAKKNPKKKKSTEYRDS